MRVLSEGTFNSKFIFSCIKARRFFKDVRRRKLRGGIIFLVMPDI